MIDETQLPEGTAPAASAPPPAYQPQESPRKRFTKKKLANWVNSHVDSTINWHVLEDETIRVCLIALPDGTPLSLDPANPAGPGLRASGKDLFERLTGSALPLTPFDCRIFLWCCTRTAAELKILWSPARPEPGDMEGLTFVVPADHRVAQLRAEALAWADAVFPPFCDTEICTLAWRTWDYEHETLLLPDRAGLDDDELTDSEKKSLYRALRGSLRLFTLSPAEILPPETTSSSTPASATSSASTEPGSITAAGT